MSYGMNYGSTPAGAESDRSAPWNDQEHYEDADYGVNFTLGDIKRLRNGDYEVELIHDRKTRILPNSVVISYDELHEFVKESL